MEPKKKPKKTKTTPKTEQLPVAEEKTLPIPILEGDRTFIMSSEEIYSLVQILGFSREVFKQLAVQSATDGDAKAQEIYTARASLSDTLFEKIRDVASIGEPTSRAFH